MNQKKGWTNHSISDFICVGFINNRKGPGSQHHASIWRSDSWQISERQKLSLSTYIAPDLSNFENYFVQTRFEWSMKLDIFSGLSLITGLRNDYQSQPSSNSNGNDFRGYAGLKLEF